MTIEFLEEKKSKKKKKWKLGPGQLDTTSCFFREKDEGKVYIEAELYYALQANNLRH